MRALIVYTALVAGCGGAGSQSGDMALASFGGNWSGTVMHDAVTCSDGTVKAAFSGGTQVLIAEDQFGILLTWSDRCPATGMIPFAVDAMGVARQQGGAVTCVNTAGAQATMSGGALSLANDQLTITINETEHSSGTQTRDCQYTLSATLTRQ